MSDIIPSWRSSAKWSRIYAICDLNDVPRYVGKTQRWLLTRFKTHVKDTKEGSKLLFHKWLRKQKKVNIKLLENTSNKKANEREKFWINKFRSEGIELLNMTDGGAGLTGMKFSKLHKARIAASNRTGSFFNCEVCKKSFWRKRNQIEKGQCRFCSTSCSNKKTGMERRRG